MNAYIYQADIYCESCAKLIIMKNSSSQVHFFCDSGCMPQGPYADGGGEADSPQHCGTCGRFLENPLTEDGYKYVKEIMNRPSAGGTSADEWAEFYAIPA